MLSTLRTCVAALLLLPVVIAHGEMSSPRPRNAQPNSTTLAGTCSGESCCWLQEVCKFSKCYTGIAAGSHDKCFDDCTKPTLTNPQYLTYPLQEFHKISKYNPWYSLGRAPVASPCGLMGGGPHCMGMQGLFLPELPKPWATRGEDLPAVQSDVHWAAGSVQDVSWSISANHGGGYAWRLCPKDGNSVTEECFQKHHLEFVGNQSWIQFSDDSANRTAIPAVRVSQGTTPPGSTWTRNPIPSCSTGPGGAMSLPGCGKPQFYPPLSVDGPWTSPGSRYTKGTPGLYGFGPGRCFQTEFNISKVGLCSADELAYWRAKFNFNIIDKVQVPSDLLPGPYLLSWRWDAEQTPQVWSNCADISIQIK